jgi:hypothetical protein
MPYAWAWKQNNMCCLLQIHLEELGKWRSDHTEEIIYKLYCIAWNMGYPTYTFKTKNN